MFHKTEKPSVSPIFLLVLVIAVAFIGYNAYVLLVPQTAGSGTIVAASTKAPILLYADNCPECFKLGAIVKPLYSNLENYSYSSTQGKALAANYSITKLPALIVFDSSDLAKAPQLSPLFTVKNGANVLDAPSAPFFDLASNSIKGKVSAIVISPLNCTQCTTVEALLAELNTTGVYLQSEKLVENAPRATQFIAKYNLSSLPAFIFSADLLDYPQFKQSWNLLGTTESDGLLVMREQLPPFKNLSTSAIEGLVQVTYLTDNSCSTCYNVSIHKNVLRNFNIYAANETTVDAASLEGQALIEKYNVTAVPTLVMSKEANVYSTLKQAWLTVGSIESDGTFIFRKFDSTPGIIYRDLTNGSIVTVPRSS